MKKITLVNQVTGPLFIDITNAFASSGFKVTLHTGNVEETYASLDEKIKIKISQSYVRKNAVMRIFTWLTFFLQVFLKLLFEKKDSPLLLVSNPPIAPFLGVFFLKLFKRPYYILIYDIYPDALVEFNYVSSNSWVVKMWSKANRNLFHLAEKIFTISKGMKEKIEEYHHGDNIYIIHSWVDSNFIKPVEKKENWFAKEHQLEDKIVVLYSGNLGTTHDIESIVEAAKIMEADSRVQFLIIGSGAKEEKIKQVIRNYKLHNTKLLPFQPSDVVPYSMTSGDISIVTLAKGAGNLSVPSKTYYMMAAGMAIISITESNSEIANLVNENEIGFVVTPGDANELVAAITILVDQKEQLGYFRNNALKLSKQFTPLNAKTFVDHCIETV